MGDYDGEDLPDIFDLPDPNDPFMSSVGGDDDFEMPVRISCKNSIFFLSTFFFRLFWMMVPSLPGNFFYSKTDEMTNFQSLGPTPSLLQQILLMKKRKKSYLRVT